MNEITDNLHRVRDEIREAAMKAQRAPDAVELIAVSKLKDAALVRQALEAGQRHFGENRVQEAEKKFPDLRRDYTDLHLHLIGPLQTNKAETAVRLFDSIQTLDRPKLAEALAQAIGKTGKTPRLLIQVNIGLEPQKAGIAPDDLNDFLTLCRNMHGLTISGLMCIPPQDQDPIPHFNHMRALASRHTLPRLSMGMSNDFPAAIACGATEVRIGTAIFGKR
jgi:pyridoxal phosphate enzyme (YggS family)